MPDGIAKPNTKRTIGFGLVPISEPSIPTKKLGKRKEMGRHTKSKAK